MNKNPMPARVGYSARRGPRLDRAFAELMVQPPEPASQALSHAPDASAHSVQPAIAEVPMRFARLRRSRLFAKIKLPLLHLRNFVTAPLSARIDALQHVVAEQQHLAHQIDATQRTVETLVRELTSRVMQLEEKGRAIETLNVKTDDSIRRLDTLRDTTANVMGKLDGSLQRLSSLQEIGSGLLVRSDDATGRLTGLQEAGANLLAKADDATRRLDGLRDTEANLMIRAEEAMVQLQKLRQSAGFLHQKADDAIIKQRAVVHLRDAYAVPLRDGYLFVPEEDEGILLMYTAATPDGLEPGTRRIIQMISPEGGKAVDVGASLGLHTLAFGRAIGPSGHIYAFEAEPRLERVLRRTFGANGLHQVSLQILAVGSEHGEATFHVARTIGHSSLYALGGPDEVREELRVKLRPLDELIPTDQMVDVIKIDVEGAELDVIKGAQQTLTRSTNCAIIAELGPSHLNRVGISLDDWIAAFTQFGMEGYAITEPFGTVTPLDREWLGRQHSVNVLFVRPGSFAAKALSTHDVIRPL